MPIEINGSWGEGGGQIARTAVGLAAALGKDIRVFNIRTGRKQSGLKAQHLAGIKLAAEMCDADFTGVEIGSSEFSFTPGKNTGGEFEVDIGTAGSISLALQTCLIPAITAGGEVRLSIRGGTDVPWSPPMDYTKHVLLRLLNTMGCDIECSIEQRGFYPSGGGKVIVSSSPCDELKGIDLSARGKLREIGGSLASRNLPDHVADRTKDSAAKELAGVMLPRIIEDLGGGPSTGISIVLVAEFENTVMGASCLGEKGLPAEKVGAKAARDLMECIRSEATIDEFASDQIVPFAFLAEGTTRFRVSDISSHLKTNIWAAQQLIKREVDIVEERKGYLVTLR